MDIKQIGQMALLMKEAELTSMEYTQGDVTLKLERKWGAEQALSCAPHPLPPVPHPVPSGAPVFPPALTGMSQEAQAAASGTPQGSTVLSPTVGVFYAAASPDGKPFVQVGDSVKKGDVLCIIEAMKLMNEIQSEFDGTVAEICVGNGQVVEFNQPLFRIV